MAGPLPENVYWIDPSGRITAVAGAWDSFALSNGGGAACLSECVIGRPLMDLIVGDACRQYMATLFERVRASARPLVRRYRCDSPMVRRPMEMRLVPEPSGLVRVEHVCLAAESRLAPVSFEYSANSHLLRCGVCNRVEFEGRWTDPDELRPTDLNIPAWVSYTVCQDCVEQLDDPRQQ